MYQKEDPLVNRRTVNRSGGDARVTFHKEVFKPSYGYTVAMAHPTVDPSKIRYFEELHVIDADDTSRTFAFSLEGVRRSERDLKHRFGYRSRALRMFQHRGGKGWKSAVVLV